MSVLVGAVVAVLATSAVLTLVRLVRGPGLLDRVVALDCLLVILVMAVAVESSTGDRSGVGLSITVSAALLSFVGTVAVARYVERTRRPPGSVAAHPDAAVPDAARPDAAHPDAAHPDAAHPDAATWDVPRPDADTGEDVR